MSRENVELYFEAKDRLAVEDHEGFAHLLHPEVTATVVGLPEPGPFVGRDALIAQLEGLGAEFDAQRYTDIDVVADRDGWIVLTYRWHVRGTASGVETEAPVAVAFRVEDAQLIEVHWRPTREDALAAAGLSEEQAVSKGNVELAYRAADAFNRRDLDAFLAFVDPDVEFRPLDVELEGGGPYRGHEGLRAWLEDQFRVFPDFSGEVEEIRDLGEITLARVRVRAHGMKSDAFTEAISWQVTRWREGKGISFRDFRTEAEALEAAGLKE